MLSKKVAIRLGALKKEKVLVNQDEGGMAFPAGRNRHCYLFMIFGISLITLQLYLIIHQ